MIFPKKNKKDKILNCVLTSEWFNKIKSGEKIHEYREVKDYWIKRIGINHDGTAYECRDINGILRTFKIPNKIRFTLGMTNNSDKVLLFYIKNITIINGKNTDLKVEKLVFDIELGAKINA